MESSEKDITFKDLILPITIRKLIAWIIFVGFVVFANMLFNNFVYDDIKYIQNNPEIHSFLISKIIGPSLFNTTSQYRPIPAIYYTLMYNLFSNTTFFYHLIQLALHIAVSVMVFFLFKKFFPILLSFFLAFIFLVHPMQVESVSYISAFDNVLFFALGMIAIFIHSSSKKSYLQIATVMLLLLFSFLTKETGFLFFFILLTYDFFFQRKEIVKTIIVGIVAITSYSLLRFDIGNVYFAKFDVIPIFQLTLPERLINIPAIFYYYVSTFFFPIHLAILQNWIVRSFDVSHFFYPLLMDIFFISCIFTLGLYVAKKHRNLLYAYLFFTAWFFLGLGFHLQILPLDQTVSDRWFYFPMVGLLGILGVTIISLKHFLINQINHKSIQVTFYTACILVLMILAIRTIIRNTNWFDEKTLLQHDILVSDDFSKEDMLALDLLSEKKYDAALVHMEKSVKFNPVSLNINNLGLIYQLKGDNEKAKEMYLRSLRFKENSNSLFAYINLSYLYVYYDDPKKAIPILQKKVLPTYPNNPDFWYLLSIAEYKSGNQEDALAAMQKAYTLSPTQNIVNMYIFISKKMPANLIELHNPTFIDSIH